MVAAAVAGIMIVSAMRQVRVELEVTPLEQHRTLAGVIQSLSTLASAVDAVRIEPTEVRRLRAVVALDRTYALAIDYRARLEAEQPGDTGSAFQSALGPATALLLAELAELDGLLARLRAPGDTQLLASWTRLSDINTTLTDAYVLANTRAVEHLDRQSVHLERLRMGLALVLLLLVGMIFGIGGLLSMQIRTTKARERARAELAVEKQRVEAALARVQATHDLYRDIFQSSPIIITMISPQGRILFANRLAFEYFGYSEGQLQRLEARDLYVRPTDRDAIAKRLAAGETVRDLDVDMVGSDGGVRHCSITFCPVSDGESGVPAAYYVWVSDLTERVRLQAEIMERTTLLQTVMDNAIQGMALYDAGGQLRAWNDRYAAMVGLAAVAPAIGQPLRSVAEALIDRGAFATGRGDALADAIDAGPGGPRAVELEADLTAAVYDLRAQPTPAGGLVITGTDITDRKAAERELRAAKETAESSLAELRETQAQLVEAEKLAALGGLVAGVAHEVNTPVGIALTAASTLRDETLGLIERTGSGAVRKSDVLAYLDLAAETTRLLQANCERAASLIASFRQVSVDQVSDERRRFDLKTYLSEVLLSLGPSLSKTTVAVSVDCPAGLELNSYPGAFSQIITNLVTNALNHAFENRQDGKIEIKVDNLSQRRFSLIFSDNGVGVPDENAPRLFEPFFTTRRGSGGSGLGLHILYNLVVGRLGGHVSFRPTPGGGATFVIEAPCDAPIGDATEAGAGPAGQQP